MNFIRGSQLNDTCSCLFPYITHWKKFLEGTWLWEANNVSANFISLGKYVGIRFINFAVDRCADIKFLTWWRCECFVLRVHLNIPLVFITNMRQRATDNTVSINVVGSWAEMLCSAVSRGIPCRKGRYPDREMWICGVREIDRSLRCCRVLVGCAEYVGFVCRRWSNDRIWIKTLRKKNKKTQWNQRGSGTGVNVLGDKCYKITGIDRVLISP